MLLLFVMCMSLVQNIESLYLGWHTPIFVKRDKKRIVCLKDARLCSCYLDCLEGGTHPPKHIMDRLEDNLNWEGWFFCV